MRSRTWLLALALGVGLGSSVGAMAQATPPAAPAVAATPPASTPATTAAPHAARKTLAQRFDAANTSHDGKLTLEQARAGHLRAVVRDFDQIDKTKRGYVTLDDIKAHQAAQRAAHRAERAAKPTTPSH